MSSGLASSSPLRLLYYIQYLLSVTISTKTFFLATVDVPLSSGRGVEGYRIFKERIRNLNLKLQAFANAVRQLNTSAGMQRAAYYLGARLAQIQYLFQENAAELFDSVLHGPNLGTKPYVAPRRGKGRRHINSSPSNNYYEPWLDDIEVLPRELEYLANDLLNFLASLTAHLRYLTLLILCGRNSASRFIEQGINISIEAFEGDLKYRASCLREFQGQLKSEAVAQYINDLTEDLGVHVDNMKDSLHNFIEIEIPQIRLSEERAAAGLLNMSAVAAFLSGVTATTLQFSFEKHGSSLPDVVNALWIGGLVFSVASTINSQVAYHWRTVMYRPPESYLPWWATIWITQTPLIFLATSVIAFLAGLCAFTYSSGQSSAVNAVVLSSLKFGETKGKKRLPAKRQASRTATIGVKRTRTLAENISRSFTDIKHRVTGVTGRMTETMASMANVPRAVFARTVSALAIVTDGMSSNQGDVESQDDNMRTDSPTAMFHTDNGSRYLGVNGNTEKRKLSDLGKGIELTAPEDKPLYLDTAIPLFTSNPVDASDYSKMDATTGTSTSNPANVEPAGRAVLKSTRFEAIAKQVVKASKFVPPAHSSEPFRFTSERMNPTRMQNLVPMLRTLRSSQMLGEHVAPVKHLQFSPDGQFLATCSWDKTALIWRVGSGASGDFVVMHKLVHMSRTGGFVGWWRSGTQRLDYVRRQSTGSATSSLSHGCRRAPALFL
ncbi:hypothetical protein BDV93DRAFT_311967 [Ceratobasidium sp. AG-I]|nr:hypothetical protein BDV93DRAFT_311967 [Ceratobasidium sp. AG-I]